MFQLQPTPKQFNNLKLAKSEKGTIKIPDNWADWARTTDINTGGGIAKFEPYDYQIKIAELMRDFNCIFIKSRQLGMTENLLSVMLHKAITNPGYNALVFSKTQTDSSNIAMRAKRALESAEIKLNTDNLRDLQLRGGGRLRFLNSKPESSRSAESVSDIFYDECSFVPDLQLIRNSSTPTQSMLGDLAREFFCSTPNGSTSGQLYYDLASSSNEGHGKLEDICKAIVAGELPPFYWFIDNSGWAKIFIHWTAHPIYSQNRNFLEDLHKKKRIPWETIHREYNLDFSSAESQYFNPLELVACHHEGLREKSAKPGVVYFAGLDSQNSGNDYCSFSIWRCDKGVFSKVNGYHKAKGSMEEHLSRIITLINQFPSLTIGLEVNSSGVLYQEQILRYKPFLKIIPVRVSSQNKAALCGRVKYHIESKKLHWEKTDPFQIDAENFRQTGDTFQAVTGKHDDEISSCAAMLEAAELMGFVGGL